MKNGQCVAFVWSPATGLAVTLACLLLFTTGSKAHVRLDTALGGETYAAGEMVELQWDAYIYHGPGTIDLEFFEDGGDSYTSIVSDIPLLSEDEAVGTYMWTVPDVNSDFCRVKVTYTAETLRTYDDASGLFTIGAGGGSGGGEGGEGAPGEFAVTIGASKDNSLYEDEGGALSNGSGEYFFAGKTGQTGAESIRRGLVAFDISAAVPTGATITRVSLSVNVSRVASAGPHEVALIPMAADWGEGSSDASGEEGMGAAAMDGDATWLHQFFPSTFWSQPGGDFASGTSATVSVGGTGVYTFVSTAETIADVQNWLDTPEDNWGWLVAGEESSSASAIRFDSRENSVEASRPALTIDYNIGGGIITSSAGTGFLESGVLLELYAPPGSSHQWYKDSVPMVDDGDPFRISGTQTDTLVFDPVSVEDSAGYHCEYETAKRSMKGLVQTETFYLEVFPEGALPVSGLAGLAALFGALAVVGMRGLR